MTVTSETVLTSPAESISDEQTAVDKSTIVDGPYAKYVLAVLVIVGIFSYIDRQIFAILAEAIKADLQLSDGDLGFLFGTAFAVFYAVFGIPLGRLADSWCRTKQISLSLGFWSIMTALSGLTKSFLPLAVCRFGVAVGEAGANPAGLSLLHDYFSPKVRTTVIGIYASGPAIGGGLGLFLGGAILGAWSNAWPDPSLAPFGLKGWQAAFMVVGLPGLLLSLLIWTLKEPARGQADTPLKIPTQNLTTNLSTVRPLQNLLREFMPMLPIVNLWLLKRVGGGSKSQLLNLGVGLLIGLAASTLIKLTGETLQWLALGIGFYCVFSWAQVLLCRDRVCFGLIFRCKTVRYLYLFFGLSFFASSAVGFWMVPWFQRYFGASAADVGIIIGLGSALGALIGAILSGVLSDWLRQYTQRGKLYVALGGTMLWFLLVIIFLFFVENLFVAYTTSLCSGLVWCMMPAPVTSTINDLMLPRTRAVGSALLILAMSFLGIALGPYCVGLFSDAFVETGADSGDALRYAMQLSLIVAVVALGFLILAVKHVVADENSLLERARALGEEV